MGVQSVYATNDITFHYFGYRLPPVYIVDRLQTTLLIGFLITGGLLFAEQKAYQRRLANAESRDPLTGFLTCAEFEQAAPTTPRPAVLAVLDIDRLKRVNDRHGRANGDRLLLNLARSVKRAMPSGSVLGRLSGDEFGIIIPNMDESAVQALFDRLRAPPAPENDTPDPSPLTFSFGTMILGPGQPTEQAFALAVHRMQLDKAKQAESDDTGLYHFFKQLEPLLTPDEVIRTALDMAHDLLEFDHTIYCLVAAAERPLPIMHALNRPGTQMEAFSVGRTLPWRNRLARAVAERQTVISVDYQNDPEAFPAFQALGVKTFMMIPVLQDGRVSGLLLLMHLRTWKPVPRETQRTAELVALRLGQALEHHRLAEAAQHTMEGGLLSLGIALEARDLETNGHTQRVVRLATALGQAASLCTETLAVLQQGASLHDIGKLTIPDAVLLKPGKLDAEEWRVMKSHVTSGVDIARRLPGLSCGVLDIIGAHHERWDGRGYPHGLAGEDIPLLARIFSLCDVYDALTHERPYKRAWSHEEARAELAAQAGKQFDPNLTTLFLELDLPAVMDAS